MLQWSRSSLFRASVLLLALAWLISIFMTSPESQSLPVTHKWSTKSNGNVHLAYGGEGDDLNSFYEEFKSHSNVDSLKIRIWGTGCAIRDQTRIFDIKRNDRLPDVRKLSTSGYDFEPRPPLHWSLWKYLLAPRGTSLDRWLKAMNFSKLEDLTLEDEETYFCTRMADKLPGLRSLSVHWPWSKLGLPEQCLEFVSKVPPLQSLSIQIGAPWLGYREDPASLERLQFPVDMILDRHGPALESLDLHQREGQIDRLRRPMLSLDTISRIQSSCPKLNHLGLDIDRNGSWPYETLDALMNMPELTSLSLGLEIGADLHTDIYDPGDGHPGLEGSGPWREPRMSTQTATELFQYLRERKAGKPLSAANFTVGNWGIDRAGWPLYFSSWDDERSTRFECTVLDSDSGQIKCHMHSEYGY